MKPPKLLAKLFKSLYRKYPLTAVLHISKQSSNFARRHCPNTDFTDYTDIALILPQIAQRTRIFLSFEPRIVLI